MDGRCVRFVFVLPIIVAACVVAAQDVPYNRPRPDTAPFAFRRIQRPTSRGLSLLEDWLAGAERHVPGEPDAAARTVSDYPEGDLADVIAACQVDPRWRRAPDNAAMADRLKRAVVLHTDVAVLVVSRSVSASADALRKSHTASLHLGAAMELVDWLKKQDRHSSDAAFQHEWYLTVAALLVSEHEIDSAPLFADRAVDIFRRDADLLLLAGGVHELLASPTVQDTDLKGVDRRGGTDEHLSKAGNFYRRALRANAACAEAHVRLGRVLGLQGDHDRALAELRSAAGGQPPVFPYFTQVFIGEEEEALEHWDAAREAYERALALRPDAQFAYLALSRTERRRGNRTGTIAAIDRMLQVPRPPAGGDDPWAEYFRAGLAPQVRRLLEELRRPFRRGQ